MSISVFKGHWIDINLNDSIPIRCVSEPFDTTLFDTDTILIPSSTEISIPIRYRYYTGPIIPILIRYRYFRGLKILILIRYRYFMEMVWYHVWYQKIWILGYFKVFIAIKPFQNYHSSDVFGAKTPLILKLITLVIKSDTDTILILHGNVMIPCMIPKNVDFMLF